LLRSDSDLDFNQGVNLKFYVERPLMMGLLFVGWLGAYLWGIYVLMNVWMNVWMNVLEGGKPGRGEG
jgi:hypothetical protein